MATTPGRNLAPAIRASLNAKLERLLGRPIIAEVVGAAPQDDRDGEGGPGIFQALRRAAGAYLPALRGDAWREDPEDGTCSVRISLDYDDLWRGCEKEIQEAVSGTVEGAVTFLTPEQKALLEKSPREFLNLNPRPESAELISFDTEKVGGSVRVVGLKLAAAPESPGRIQHLAIVPNLVQIERQLDALQVIENGSDDGVNAPLRALLGLCDTACLPGGAGIAPAEDLLPGERLDEHQTGCIRKAIATPHFAVIQGPPGSGKTTVISAIIRRAVARGERVLVVSPTHVAVDNVAEKLAPPAGSEADDPLDPHTLPVRYAARSKRLSDRAMEYWVGSKKQRRAATIAKRVQDRLTEKIPFAKALYDREDKDAPGNAPLSSAVARADAVICGTPIGILSHAPVKNAEPGSFGLLIVDEVSKMTIAEFLAIAVKARRYVLVGDPEQLPPYNNCEENACTLDDVLDPRTELVCSVGSILERARPYVRRGERLVVVSAEPESAIAAIRAHLDAVKLDNLPPIALHEETETSGIVVCGRDEVDRACECLSPARARDRSHNPESNGSVRILVERGLVVPRPELASGNRFVEARLRAQAVIFENCFNVYHAWPWSKRSDQKLRVVGFRKGLDKYLPSAAALERVGATRGASSDACRSALVDGIAERVAINTVSVYDWIAGIPAHFDVSPLREFDALHPAALCEAVRPFVGTLKKQYRMHCSLSLVPRRLFYFGEALHDHAVDDECRVSLLQVEAEGDEGESNQSEADAICAVLAELNSAEAAREHRPGIMIITPYRAQEALLAQAINDLRERGALERLDVEVCTLDRCQGREAEYVLISLVRNRATPFFDMPKRWNVALTRAREGLFLVGNIDAYLAEAQKARQELRMRRARANGNGTGQEARLLMSLVARILEEYESLIRHRGRRAG